MNETLKDYAAENYEGSDHDTLIQWLIEIEEAIEDGDDVSESNRLAYESRPACWAKTGFESGVVIADDPRGVSVWMNVDTNHVAKANRGSEIAAAEHAKDDELLAEFGPRPGFNRGVRF